MGGRRGRADQRELKLSEARAELPERSAHEQTLLDHLVLGFSLERHLVESYRRRLRALRVIPSVELARTTPTTDSPSSATPCQLPLLTFQPKMARSPSRPSSELAKQGPV